MHSINYFVSVQTQLKFQVLFVKTARATTRFLLTGSTLDTAVRTGGAKVKRGLLQSGNFYFIHESS